MRTRHRLFAWAFAVAVLIGLAVLYRGTRRANETLAAEQSRLNFARTQLESEISKAKGNRGNVVRPDELKPRDRELSSKSAANRQRDLLAYLDRLPIEAEQKTIRQPVPSGRHGNVYFSELLETPGYSDFMRDLFRVSVESRYGVWLETLTATPELQTRVRKLLIEQRFIQFDSEEIIIRAGLDLDRNRKELFQLRHQLQSALLTELRETLGDAGYRAFEAFSSTVPARESIAPLITRLGYSDEPLSREQVNEIVSLMPPPNAAPAKIEIEVTLLPARTMFSPKQWEQMLEFARDGGKLRR